MQILQSAENESFFISIKKKKIVPRCLLLFHFWCGKIFRIAEFLQNGKSDSFYPPFTHLL